MSEASVPLEKFRKVCEEYDKLEQQLAQAREENKHLHIQRTIQDQLYDVAQTQIEALEQQNAAMRALLEEAAESLWMEGDHDTAGKIRAFLREETSDE